MAADYRRRRLRALGGVGGLALVLGVIVGAGAGDSQPAAGPSPSLCDRPGNAALPRVAGQGLVVRMGAQTTPRLLAQARTGAIGGVVLFPPSNVKTAALEAQIERLQRAADAGGNPPLFITIDQEGGIVKRLPTVPPQLSPYTLGQLDRPSSARLEGEATGYQLRRIGINVDLAPVVDIPSSDEQYMNSRAFGLSPGKVRRLAMPFARGLLAERVTPTFKHFPGLGRALENTDYAPTSVTASRALLLADALPYRAAIADGRGMVMVSLASYPGLGDAKRPAALSRTIVTDLLRDRLGFHGVVISDDLLAPAVATSTAPTKAVEAAANAGVDLKLLARKPTSSPLSASLASAARNGVVSAAELRQQCRRVLRLKEALPTTPPKS